MEARSKTDLHINYSYIICNKSQMRKYNRKPLNNKLWLDRLYICTFVENEDLNKGDHGKEKDLWSPG